MKVATIQVTKTGMLRVTCGTAYDAYPFALSRPRAFEWAYAIQLVADKWDPDVIEFDWSVMG